MNLTKKLSSRVIWITGLSGSGKSTLAAELVARLQSTGHFVIALDGDGLRNVLCEQDTVDVYTRHSRLALGLRYARLCKLISSQGAVVVISTISLFNEIHLWNRTNIPGYFEVYLKIPVHELRNRDTKGLYRRFDLGELSQIAGLDIHVDEPVNPDFAPSYSPNQSARDLADQLFSKLLKEPSK